MIKAVEANQIYPGLWQGSAPPQGSILRDAGFSLLVLCAQEHQPPGRLFEGVTVLNAPNDDHSYLPPSREQLQIALDAANQVAKAVQQQNKVLVTCWMGINRSGLVTALALHKLLGISGLEACALIRKARPSALSNPQFISCLTRIQSSS
jgi:hypothetical protein